MKILIVDDEEVIRMMVSEYLVDEEVFEEEDIFLAENGVHGLEQYEKIKPELILTDMMMPQLNGDKMIQKIRENDKQTEIVVMTGYADLDMAVSVIKMGVTELIRKPFQPQEIILVIRKILEKFDLIQSNKNMLKKLQQSEKLASLGVLAAGIAHEINNPNTFIKGNFDLLRKYMTILAPHIEEAASKEGPDQNKLKMILDSHEKVISSAINGAERIKKITSGLLSFSRNNPEDLREECKVVDIVDQAHILTSHRVKKHNFHLNIPDDVHSVSVNEQEMVQVFMNLFVNACDAMEEKLENTTEKGNLTITVTEDHDRKVQIVTVADDGCGMAPEIRAKIFDPFFTTKAQGKGTGLGMSITIGNIQTQNGQLDLKTEAGQGSEFIITLPYLTP